MLPNSLADAIAEAAQATALAINNGINRCQVSILMAKPVLVSACVVEQSFLSTAQPGLHVAENGKHVALVLWWCRSSREWYAQCPSHRRLRSSWMASGTPSAVSSKQTGCTCCTLMHASMDDCSRLYIDANTQACICHCVVPGPCFPNKGDQERFWRMTRRFVEELAVECKCTNVKAVRG